MAEVVAFPGSDAPRVVQAENVPVEGIPAILRSMADMIERGEIAVDAAVVLLSQPEQLIVQSLCVNRLEVLGLLSMAQHLLTRA